MPYTEAHHKITIYGDAYNGAEQWSFGFRMQTVAPDNASSQARADALSPAVLALWNNNLLPQFFSTHRLQGVKVAIIQPDGTYPPDHVPGEVFYANIPGPAVYSVDRPWLPQASVAVTLTTAKPRGLASKGRFFLPPQQLVVMSDGLILDSNRDDIVTRVRTLINAANAIEAGNANVAIFSRGVGVKTFNAATGKIEWTYPNPGVTEPVTRVEVGRVVDTQRRRRRSLVESREGQDVVP